MIRKIFIYKCFFTLLMVISFFDTFSQEINHLSKDEEKARILNAYYLRAHTYTLVPSQVRQDMEWMKSVGTTVLSVTVLEQDLYAAVENISIICKEAHNLGMQVFIVPSRLGGLVAGAPKVPSYFSVTHPKSWVLDKNKKPIHSDVSGVYSSIYDSKTLNFFKNFIKKAIETWPISGIIWDEIKVFDMLDYSEHSLKFHNGIPTLEKHNAAVSDFFSEINEYAKKLKPELIISATVYGNTSSHILPYLAKIKFIDYVGMDGRPWGLEDKGTAELNGKVIIGQQKRFKEAALKEGKKLVVLIENHNMRAIDNKLMDKKLPEVLDLNIPHLIYYYYPRNISNPEQHMGILKKHLFKYYAK